METRHPVEGPFSREFSAFVVIAVLWKPEVARPGSFLSNFCVFFGKTTPYGKIFKTLFRKISPPHRLTLLCWNVVKFARREIGEIVRYLPQKIPAASQTVVTAQIVPKNCQEQPPTFGSQCSKFHPNRFTFGGVTAEWRLFFVPIDYLQYSPEGFRRIMIRNKMKTIHRRIKKYFRHCWSSCDIVTFLTFSLIIWIKRKHWSSVVIKYVTWFRTPTSCRRW